MMQKAMLQNNNNTRKMINITNIKHDYGINLETLTLDDLNKLLTKQDKLIQNK